MLRTVRIEVHNDEPLFDYLDFLTKANTNLYNAGLFVSRQVLTGVEKAPANRQPNEQNVLNMIQNALPQMDTENMQFKMPQSGKGMLTYPFLYRLFHVTQNPDYFADGFPRKCAQQTLKQVAQDMHAFFAQWKAYSANPVKGQGKPKLPGYKRKGKGSTVSLTNQTCHIEKTDDGTSLLEFPKWNKQRPVAQLGNCVNACWKFTKATVVPYQENVFRLNLVFEDGKALPELREPSRICAIDLGVDNFAAITNNIGKPAMLIKGKCVKSVNVYYNKRMANLKSQQTRGKTNAKGGPLRFVPTDESRMLSRYRDHWMSDFMHKAGRLVVNWCLANDIDTIVVGANKLWKNKCHIGYMTQTFVQIPYDSFKRILAYLCEWNGIRYVEQEESYTSLSSFLNQDPIPVFGSQSENLPEFTGTRMGRLYENRDTNGEVKIVNADINGSANIGRKAFPGLFTPNNCDILSHPLIWKHPDMQPVTASKSKGTHTTAEPQK